MDHKSISTVVRGGVKRTGASVEAGICGVATDRRIRVTPRRWGSETHAPLASACPVGGDAMLARGTAEHDVQFYFIGRGLGASGREGPLGNGARDSEAGLCDGGEKRRGGGKGEKGASQHRSHDIAGRREYSRTKQGQAKRALELQRGFHGRRVLASDPSQSSDFRFG